LSELFKNSSPALAMALPDSGTSDQNSESMQWQPSGTDGFWLKPLFESAPDKLRTWLMKVDPGSYSPMHAHTEIEQIYVMEGSFYDQHKTYGPGDMIVRAPGAEHEAGSESGGLMLVSYAPKRTSA